MTDNGEIWLWRAWNKDRERICDCGIVRAATEETARGIAWRCIGGPHMTSITSIEVSKVSSSGYEISKVTQGPR